MHRNAFARFRITNFALHVKSYFICLYSYACSVPHYYVCKTLSTFCASCYHITFSHVPDNLCVDNPCCNIPPSLSSDVVKIISSLLRILIHRYRLIFVYTTHGKSHRHRGWFLRKQSYVTSMKVSQNALIWTRFLYCDMCHFIWTMHWTYRSPSLYIFEWNKIYLSSVFCIGDTLLIEP